MAKYNPVVDIDRTPAHHKLQPGDWYQFIFDAPFYHAVGEGGDDVVRPAEVGDVIIWRFKDEPFRRQFRVLEIPLENVLSCAYISRC